MNKCQFTDDYNSCTVCSTNDTISNEEMLTNQWEVNVASQPTEKENEGDVASTRILPRPCIIRRQCSGTDLRQNNCPVNSSTLQKNSDDTSTGVSRNYVRSESHVADAVVDVYHESESSTVESEAASYIYETADIVFDPHAGRLSDSRWFAKDELNTEESQSGDTYCAASVVRLLHGSVMSN